MATEPIQGGPYPVPADPPDGPAQGKAVVDWAAVRQVMRFASAAARLAVLPAPVNGMVSWLESTHTLSVYDAGAWRVVWEPDLEVTVTARTGTGVTGTFTVTRKQGVIYLTGSLSGLPTSYPMIIANLPAWAYPRSSFKVAVGGSGNFNEALRLMSVTNVGEVYWINNSGPSGAPATGTSIFLTGISYLAPTS